MTEHHPSESAAASTDIDAHSDGELSGPAGVEPGGSIDPLPPSDASDLANRIAENVESVIVGHRAAIEHLLTAMLARGHVLIEDVPGVGKTMLARSIARSLDGTFKRIQFTPDLLPSDVTGVNVFNQRTREFEFRRGPIFANVMLGDEINRAPPKTQSALLEGMEERQVTVDGETHGLPRPFMVIATQNTVEHDRTYDLPMAELDRFMKRIHLGYPDRADEVEVLSRVVERHPIEDLAPVATVDALVRARRTVATVTVNEPIRDYAARLAAFTRDRSGLGASPRGTIALVRAAQARAILDRREYVIPDDVQAELRSVFGHRVSAPDRPVDDLLDDALDRTPVP